MTKDEALKLALDKKADNARELGLDYEPENTLHWHALNYRTAPTQNAQAMFEALEKFVEAAIKEALAQPEEAQSALSLFQSGFIDGKEKGLKEALAQTQEPVAWGVDWGKAGDMACVSIIKRLPNDVIEVVAVEYAPYSYTHPPQRTWVGLTDEERKNIMIECESTGDWAWELKAAQAIEAKLREKNT